MKIHSGGKQWKTNSQERVLSPPSTVGKTALGIVGRREPALRTAEPRGGVKSGGEVVRRGAQRTRRPG